MSAALRSPLIGPATERTHSRQSAPTAAQADSSTEARTLLTSPPSRAEPSGSLGTRPPAVTPPAMPAGIFSPDEPVTFHIPGEPQGKGRARSFLMRGRIVTTTPPKTRSYEGIVASLAMDAMGDRPPFDGPVQIDLSAFFGVPQSWSRKKQAAALAGMMKPGKKPDLDNIAKAITDGMNGVVMRDDSLIVAARLSKRYGPQPMVVVTVKPA